MGRRTSEQNIFSSSLNIILFIAGLELREGIEASVLCEMGSCRKALGKEGGSQISPPMRQQRPIGRLVHAFVVAGSPAYLSSKSRRMEPMKKGQQTRGIKVKESGRQIVEW